MGCCCSKSSRPPSDGPGPRPGLKPTNRGLPTGSDASTPSGWYTESSSSTAGNPWPECMETYQIGVRSSGPRPDSEVALSPRQLPSPSVKTPSSSRTVARKTSEGLSRMQSSRNLRAEQKQRDPRQNRSDPYH
ncbi:hypothetical protein PspLS_03929 [Pyricularia sp. CBS 133598]|nr:hypothetical protein PspLS_03929 [Pyricularia sp. CBS 133598]